MKYWSLLFLPVFVGCVGPDAPIRTAPGETIAEIVTSAPEIAAQVATGQYWAAGITAVGLIGTALGWKGYKRVKASPPGSLGILAPKSDA